MKRMGAVYYVHFDIDMLLCIKLCHWEPSPSNNSEFTVIGERSQFSQTAQPKGGGGHLVRL